MPEYRAYIVGEDGQFVGYEPIVCANDNEATEHARHLSNRGPVELWSGPYLLVQLAAAKTSDHAITHHGELGNHAAHQSKVVAVGDNLKDIIPAK